MNIHGKIRTGGPLTLHNASGGNIAIGNRADIYAPDITLTTLRAAYLATGTGRFDGASSNPASVIVNGDLLATSGSSQVLGAYVVVNQQGHNWRITGVAAFHPKNRNEFEQEQTEATEVRSFGLKTETYLASSFKGITARS